MAQDRILVHHAGGTEVFGVNDTDSAYFNSDQSIMYFAVNGVTSEFAVDDIDSITVEPVDDSTGDDVNAIHSDSNLTISGGTIQVTVEGDQSKGIDSNKEIIISGGTITMETSGGIVLEPLGQGYDPAGASTAGSTPSRGPGMPVSV
jgi:hypothetical protein